MDVNGDGKIDGEDQVCIGKLIMFYFIYVFDFFLGYEGFILFGLFYGIGECYMIFGNCYQLGEGKYLYYENQLNYWRLDNIGVDFFRILISFGVNGNNNKVGLIFWMWNVLYFCLKDLQLSYDFKYKYLKKCDWLQMCCVNLSGSNFFIILGVSKFFDLEILSISGDGYFV